MKKLNFLIATALSFGLFATEAQAAALDSPTACSATTANAGAEGEQVIYGVKIVKTDAGRKSEVYSVLVSGIVGQPIPVGFNTASSDLVARTKTDGSADPAKLGSLNFTILPVSYNQANGSLRTKVDIEQIAQAPSYKSQNCMELGAEALPMLLYSNGDPEKAGGSKVEAFFTATRMAL